MLCSPIKLPNSTLSLDMDASNSDMRICFKVALLSEPVKKGTSIGWNEVPWIETWRSPRRNSSLGLSPMVGLAAKKFSLA